MLLTEAAQAPQLLEISQLRPSQVPSVLRFGKFAPDVKLLKFSQSQYTSYRESYRERGIVKSETTRAAMRSCYTRRLSATSVSPAAINITLPNTQPDKATPARRSTLPHTVSV